MVDATDDFDGDLSNWTQTGGGFIVFGSEVIEVNASTDASMWWSADNFTSNQYSQATLGYGDFDGAGPLVRHQPAAITYYQFLSAGTSCTIYEVTGGFYAAIGAGYANDATAGSVLKLEISGTTLTPSFDGTPLSTRSDASITGGAPGLHIYDTSETITSWLGGPIDLNPKWSIVGISSGAIDAADDYTLTEPAGCAQNDILVVDFTARSTVIFANSDWTFVQSDTGGNTTNNTTASDTSFQTGYCIRGASAPNLVFTRTGGSRAFGTIRAYRSSRAGPPSFGTSAQVAMGASGTAVTLSGGVTPIESFELIVAALHNARTASTTNTAITFDSASGSHNAIPSGPIDTTTAPSETAWAERTDRGNTTSPTVAQSTFDAVQTSPGTTGDLTVTASASALHGMTVMTFRHPRAIPHFVWSIRQAVKRAAFW